MEKRIPNLWRSQEDAFRLYNLYLCHLLTNDLYERVVFACRQIRRYAAHGRGREQGLFTFSLEIDALCSLGRYQAAWRQLRQRDALLFGEPFDPMQRTWSSDDVWCLLSDYAPLLFFLGRYRHGCDLLETALGLWMGGRKVNSFDITFHVYNGGEQPCHRLGVTLSHFYDRLNKDLCAWQHWGAFVGGFHPRLFRLAGVSCEELLTDPGRLADFFNALMEIRAERTISGVGGSQSDLIESTGKVRKRQEVLKRKLAEFREQIKPVQKRTNQKLLGLFPELRSLRI